MGKMDKAYATTAEGLDNPQPDDDRLKQMLDLFKPKPQYNSLKELGDDFIEQTYDAVNAPPPATPDKCEEDLAACQWLNMTEREKHIFRLGWTHGSIHQIWMK